MDKKDLLILAIFTFLALSLWAVFGVVKKVETQTISPQIIEEIKPLPQSIEREVLHKLPERIQN